MPQINENYQTKEAAGTSSPNQPRRVLKDPRQDPLSTAPNTYYWGQSSPPTTFIESRKLNERNFRVTAGRKGTLHSDLREQEEPEKNATTRKKNTTSRAEKEEVTDPWTTREQEDIGDANMLDM
ncbi:hypothetical protein NDU88_004656 [Pleurodeles waltl]|uniref:Uncharacterized protein n=1 Tax=Pleurodeles waltl TaxID=8319 RepID=A0AAV7NK41_PLEWA|nr:hypothetical protein NDU88_004656 [Pleurodeles waltl]